MRNTKLRITIDIFSGRENPVIEFTGKKLKDLSERLSPVSKIETRQLGIPLEPTLGYRGLIVEQVGRPLKGLPAIFRFASGTIIGREISFSTADKNFEDFILANLPKSLPLKSFKKEFKRFKELIEFRNKQYWHHSSSEDKVSEDLMIDDDELLREVKYFKEPIDRVPRYWPWPPFSWWHRCKYFCAPIYEPSWWNVPNIQPYNNCYNYATNYRTDTFAQPGKASGSIYSVINCNDVKAGAIADALIDAPYANNKYPTTGHLVALVIWPGFDFHWYRKDRYGRWSHKPGRTPVTNKDNSGNLIYDPRTADRGPYTDFCTFMIVKHGHIKIR